MFFLDSSLLSLTEYPALNENLNLGKTENKNFLERSENKDNRYLSCMEKNNIFDDFECDVDDSDKDKDYVPKENSTDSEDLNLKVLQKKIKCVSKNLNSLAHH